VKVVSPTGETLARGERGEVCSRGYHVMIGYWGDPKSTSESIDADGWMHTGDLGAIDEDGYLRIEGRLKDMILRGGENIYPAEIEAFLLKHPLISEVYVIGVPSPKYGEEVMAWIKLKPGGQLTEHDLRTWCHGQVSAFKIPKHWKIVDTFPMTVTGKVQKYRLREAAKNINAEEMA
jgi:fatty-acyl-CoA synthase